MTPHQFHRHRRCDSPHPRGTRNSTRRWGLCCLCKTQRTMRTTFSRIRYSESGDSRLRSTLVIFWKRIIIVVEAAREDEDLRY